MCYSDMYDLAGKRGKEGNKEGRKEEERKIGKYLAIRGILKCRDEMPYELEIIYQTLVIKHILLLGLIRCMCIKWST